MIHGKMIKGKRSIPFRFEISFSSRLRSLKGFVAKCFNVRWDTIHKYVHDHINSCRIDLLNRTISMICRSAMVLNLTKKTKKGQWVGE